MTFLRPNTQRHLILIWSAFMITLLLGCSLRNGVVPNAGSGDPIDHLRLIGEAWNTIQRVYVDRAALKPQSLTYGAIGGMVEALGDTGHSHFLTPEMRQQERYFERGELHGIGAEVQIKNNQVVIVAPLDDSPAQRSGLKPADVIMKVDGKDVVGLPLDQVVERILGPPGTSVSLTVFRPNTDRTLEINLVRARIPLRSVDWHPLPETSIVHLRIAAFSKGTGRDLEKALKEIQKRPVTGLILDLRNNPGGIFDEAVRAASQFLGSGLVLLEKDATGQITPVPVRRGGAALDVPTVALINAGTSSGAEIVAGALQDAHRSRLVGEKTFGTGTVLEPFPLSDGSALLLATKEWLTPAGRSIWHVGISPDIAVTLSSEAVPLRPSTERNMTADQLKASGDMQLLRALELLVPPAPPASSVRP